MVVPIPTWSVTVFSLTTVPSSVQPAVAVSVEPEPGCESEPKLGWGNIDSKLICGAAKTKTATKSEGRAVKRILLNIFLIITLFLNIRHFTSVVYPAEG